MCFVSCAAVPPPSRIAAVRVQTPAAPGWGVQFRVRVSVLPCFRGLPSRDGDGSRPVPFPQTGSFMRARPVGPLGFQDRPGGGGVCCSRRLSPIPRPLWGDPGRPWPPLSTCLALLTAVSFSNVRNAAVVCARALLARGPQVSSFRLSPFDGCTAVFRLFSYRRLKPIATRRHRVWGRH